MAAAERIPVNIVTGFLGSGKTTLINRILKGDDFRNCAVIVNELGEVGLDHLLIERVEGETLVLAGGCVCCTINEDLAKTLKQLLDQRSQGDIPAFDRVVIETTGIADPAPILYTLNSERVIARHFRIANMVTTIDAVNADLQLGQNPEAVKQAAMADRLMVTKTDLAESFDALKRRLDALNPAAPVFDVRGAWSADDLFRTDIYSGERAASEVSRWLDRAEAQPDDHGHEHAHHDIRAFRLGLEGSMDWTMFGIWLTMLLNAHGANILRVKGLLNVGDALPPVVVQGAQHIVHPPAHLADWPSDDRRSRLIFIVRGLDQGAIERSLTAFMEAARQ